MALSLRYAVRSDLGLVRGNNEDSVYAGPRLLAIADGMGGHAAGEVASKIVIATMEPLDDDRVPGDLIAALRSAVLEANQRIADEVGQNRELDGMGTTLTALRFAGSQVALVHVGDSRAYLLRGGQLSQITHDDTYVQYLVDSGKLTAEEAKDHPRKSVILRALRGAEVDPDVSIREAQDGDRYLLCSDGLSDVVSIETMHEALQIADPQESADRLVELALRSGGPDNVTVIVADAVNARRGEVFDDVPVRDGAFVDPAAHETSPDDSPAERAAAMARPKREPAPPAAKKRSGWWKTPAIIVGILVLIFAALGGTYAWAQTQYYVGQAGNEVAIYQGVNASFGPIKFSEVYRNTDLKMSRLNPAWRSQVESGITADSKSDAVRIVQRLHDETTPPCPPSTAPPTAPSTALTDPSTSASTSSTSRARSTGSSTGATRKAGSTPVSRVVSRARSRVTSAASRARSAVSSVKASTTRRPKSSRDHALPAAQKPTRGSTRPAPRTSAAPSSHRASSSTTSTTPSSSAAPSSPIAPSSGHSSSRPGCR